MLRDVIRLLFCKPGLNAPVGKIDAEHPRPNQDGYHTCQSAVAISESGRILLIRNLSTDETTTGGSVSRSARSQLTYPDDQAAATARFAITPIKWARYSALAWMSLLSASAETETPLNASAEKFPERAASISEERKTPFASSGYSTRAAPPDWETKTPTSA